IHAIRDEVATRLVTAQTTHTRNDFLAESVQFDLRRARGTEEDDGPLAERQREMHRERVAGDDHVRMAHQSGEMAHRVVASRIEEWNVRRALQSIVALLLRRSSEQQELHVFAPADARDQLEISVFPPLLER